ncbi:unnamed protein product [Rotaria socialis]|uniref:Helitron helicase-like domain-containing protein n=1 Tax=Rotaria socialis TaxID=392032 RepID=A0A820CDZ3_9BILA|nr:unnamed protein product [Rotaria socialis]
MSMSSLAEGVCGICNIRCYQRDLRRVPLNKMPSIELPKTPEDLCSVVPCIQRTQNLHSNEKYNINNDVDLAMVESEAAATAQSAIKGNCISFPQDVVNIAATLPLEHPSYAFPYGCGSIEDGSRPVKIDFRERLRYLLSFGDCRFEEHYSFIFVVFNILQHRTACFHAHLMTLIRYFQQSAQLLESLSSADIATALVNISKGTYSNIADQRINTLMKHIRGVLWYYVDYDRKNAATGAELPIQETERVEKEVIPTCLPTPNSTHDDFQRIFRNDVVRIVETSNIHRHSANCYKYSKANPDGLKTCRMRVPRALVENSHIDVSTGQITMRRSYPWINNFNEWLINACRCNMDIKFIWTGSDAKALVYYITVYVTKSSLAFYDMFALAQQEIKSIEQQHMGLKMLLKNRANSCYAVLRYDYFTSSSFWCSSGIVSSELWRSLHYAHI